MSMRSPKSPKKTDSSFSFLQTGLLSMNTRSPSLENLNVKNILGPLQTYTYTEGNSSLSPLRNRMRSLNENPKFKTQIIVVNCSKHANELLKFIDSNSSTFAPQCDCCIVDPNAPLGNMKLERITDLQDRIRMGLMTNIQQLRELEVQLETITREINITNALRNPLMGVIDHMETKINKEIEYVFKRLRERFTILNPLAGVQKDVKEKLGIEITKARLIDSQGPDALGLLRELLKGESKAREEMALFRANVSRKVEDAKKYNPVMDKDFGYVQNAYEEFSEITKKICEKFMLSFK